MVQASPDALFDLEDLEQEWEDGTRMLLYFDRAAGGSALLDLSQVFHVSDQDPPE